MNPQPDDIIEDDDEDVEGHRFVYNVDGPDDEDDTEGHLVRM
jgi:hypothetical protein